MKMNNIYAAKHENTCKNCFKFIKLFTVSKDFIKPFCNFITMCDTINVEQHIQLQIDCRMSSLAEIKYFKVYAVAYENIFCFGRCIFIGDTESSGAQMYLIPVDMYKFVLFVKLLASLFCQNTLSCPRTDCTRIGYGLQAF